MKPKTMTLESENLKGAKGAKINMGKEITRSTQCQREVSMKHIHLWKWNFWEWDRTRPGISWEIEIARDYLWISEAQKRRQKREGKRYSDVVFPVMSVVVTLTSIAPLPQKRMKRALVSKWVSTCEALKQGGCEPIQKRDEGVRNIFWLLHYRPNILCLLRALIVGDQQVAHKEQNQAFALRPSSCTQFFSLNAKRPVSSLRFGSLAHLILSHFTLPVMSKKHEREVLRIPVKIPTKVEKKKKLSQVRPLFLAYPPHLFHFPLSFLAYLGLWLFGCFLSAPIGWSILSSFLFSVSFPLFSFAEVIFVKEGTVLAQYENTSAMRLYSVTPNAQLLFALFSPSLLSSLLLSLLVPNHKFCKSSPFFFISVF